MVKHEYFTIAVERKEFQRFSKYEMLRTFLDFSSQKSLKIYLLNNSAYYIRLLGDFTIALHYGSIKVEKRNRQQEEYFG